MTVYTDSGTIMRAAKQAQVSLTGVRHVSGRRTGFRFRILPQRDDQKYRSRSGRLVHACSWETHRDFMRAIYRLDPTARIRTAYADYLSSDHFEATHEATQSARAFAHQQAA